MTIDLGLTGKRALVTGSGIGIGRATAVWLARAGCDVTLVDLDAAVLADAAAEVAAEGTRVHTVTADLRDPDAGARDGRRRGGRARPDRRRGEQRRLARRSGAHAVPRRRRRLVARHRGAEPARDDVLLPGRGPGDGRLGRPGSDRERELGRVDPTGVAHGPVRRGEGRRSTASPRRWPSSSGPTASAWWPSRRAPRSPRSCGPRSTTPPSTSSSPPIRSAGSPSPTTSPARSSRSRPTSAAPSPGSLVFGDNGAHLARNRPSL